MDSDERRKKVESAKEKLAAFRKKKARKQRQMAEDSRTSESAVTGASASDGADSDQWSAASSDELEMGVQGAGDSCQREVSETLQHMPELEEGGPAAPERPTPSLMPGTPDAKTAERYSLISMDTSLQGQNRIAELQNAVRHRDRLIQQLSAGLEGTVTRLQSQQAQAAEFQQLSEQVSFLQLQLSQAEEKLHSQTEKQSASSLALQRAQEEILRLQTCLQEKTELIAEVSKQFDVQAEELRQAQEACSYQQAKEVQYQRQMKAMQEEHGLMKKTLNGAIESLEVELSSLREDATERLQNAESAKAALATQECDSLQKELDQLALEHKQSLEELEILRSQNRKLETEVVQWEVKRDSSQEDLDSGAHHHLKLELKQLQDQHQLSLEELKKLKAENGNLAQALQELERQSSSGAADRELLEAIQMELNELKEERTDYMSQLEDLKQQNDEANSQLEILDETQKQLQQYKTENSELRNSINTQNGLIVKLREDLETSATDRDRLAQTVKVERQKHEEAMLQMEEEVKELTKQVIFMVQRVENLTAEAESARHSKEEMTSQLEIVTAHYSQILQQKQTLQSAGRTHLAENELVDGKQDAPSHAEVSVWTETKSDVSDLIAVETLTRSSSGVLESVQSVEGVAESVQTHKMQPGFEEDRMAHTSEMETQTEESEILPEENAWFQSHARHLQSELESLHDAERQRQEEMDRLQAEFCSLREERGSLISQVDTWKEELGDSERQKADLMVQVESLLQQNQSLEQRLMETEHAETAGSGSNLAGAPDVQSVEAQILVTRAAEAQSQQSVSVPLETELEVGQVLSSVVASAPSAGAELRDSSLGTEGIQSADSVATAQGGSVEEDKPGHQDLAWMRLLQELKEEKQSLEQDVARLREELRKLEETHSSLTLQQEEMLREASHGQQVLQEKLTAGSEEADLLRKEVHQQAEDLRRVKAELDNMNTQHRELLATTEDLCRAKAELDNMTTQHRELLATTEELKAEQSTRLAEVTLELETAQEQIQEFQHLLAETKMQHQSVQEELREKIQALEAEKIVLSNTAAASQDCQQAEVEEWKRQHEEEIKKMEAELKKQKLTSDTLLSQYEGTMHLMEKEHQKYVDKKFEEMNVIKKALSDCLEKLKAQETRNKTSERQIAILQAELDEQSQKCLATTAAFTRQGETFRAQLASFLNKLSLTEKNQEDMQQQLQSMQEIILEKEEASLKAQQQLQASREEVRSCQTQIHELELQLSDANHRLQNLQEDVERSSSMLASSRAATSEALQQVETLETTVSETRAEVENLQLKNSALEAAREQSETDCLSVKACLDNAQSDYQCKVEDLQKKMSQLQEEKDCAHDTIQSLQEQLISDKGQFETECLAVEARHEQSVAKYTSQMKDLQDRIVHLQDERDQASDTIRTLQEQIISDKAQFEKDIKRLGDLLGLAEEDKHQLEMNLQAAKESFDSTIAECRRDFERVEGAHAQLCEEKNKMEVSFLQEQEMVDAEHCLQLSLLESELAALRKGKSEKEEELRVLRGEINLAVEENRQQVKGLEEQIAALQSEKETLKTNFDSCMVEMQQQIQQQESDIRTLQSHSTEHVQNSERSQEELKMTYEAQISELEDKLNRVEADLGMLQPQFEELQARKQQLQQQLDSQVPALESNCLALEQEASGLRQELNSTITSHQRERNQLSREHAIQIADMEEGTRQLEEDKTRLEAQVLELQRQQAAERDQMSQSFEMQFAEQDERRHYLEQEVSKLRKHLEEMAADHRQEQADLQKVYESQIIDLEDRLAQANANLNRVTKQMMIAEEAQAEIKTAAEQQVLQQEMKCRELQKAYRDAVDQLTQSSSFGHQEKVELEATFDARLHAEEEQNAELQREVKQLRRKIAADDLTHQEMAEAKLELTVTEEATQTDLVSEAGVESVQTKELEQGLEQLRQDVQAVEKSHTEGMKQIRAELDSSFEAQLAEMNSSVGVLEGDRRSSLEMSLAGEAGQKERIESLLAAVNEAEAEASTLKETVEKLTEEKQTLIMELIFLRNKQIPSQSAVERRDLELSQASETDGVQAFGDPVSKLDEGDRNCNASELEEEPGQQAERSMGMETVDLLFTQIDDLTTYTSTLQAKIAALEEHSAQLSSERDAIVAENASLAAKLQSLPGQGTDKLSTGEGDDQSASELAAVREAPENPETSLKLQLLMEENAWLTAANVDLEKKLSSLSAEKVMLSQEMAEMEKNSELAGELQVRLENSQEELNHLQMSMTNLTASNAELTATNLDMMEQNDKLSSEISLLRDDLCTLAAKVGDLQSENSRLLNESAVLHADQTASLETVPESDGDKTHLHILMAEVVTLREQAASLNSLTQVLKQQKSAPIPAVSRPSDSDRSLEMADLERDGESATAESQQSVFEPESDTTRKVEGENDGILTSKESGQEELSDRWNTLNESRKTLCQLAEANVRLRGLTSSLAEGKAASSGSSIGDRSGRSSALGASSDAGRSPPMAAGLSPIENIRRTGVSIETGIADELALLVSFYELKVSELSQELCSLQQHYADLRHHHQPGVCSLMNQHLDDLTVSEGIFQPEESSANPAENMQSESEISSSPGTCMWPIPLQQQPAVAFFPSEGSASAEGTFQPEGGTSCSYEDVATQTSAHEDFLNAGEGASERFPAEDDFLTPEMSISSQASAVTDVKQGFHPEIEEPSAGGGFFAEEPDTEKTSSVSIQTTLQGCVEADIVVTVPDALVDKEDQAMSSETCTAPPDVSSSSAQHGILHAPVLAAPVQQKSPHSSSGTCLADSDQEAVQEVTIDTCSVSRPSGSPRSENRLSSLSDSASSLSAVQQTEADDVSVKVPSVDDSCQTEAFPGLPPPESQGAESESHGEAMDALREQLRWEKVEALRNLEAQLAVEKSNTLEKERKEMERQLKQKIKAFQQKQHQTFIQAYQQTKKSLQKAYKDKLKEKIGALKAERVQARDSPGRQDLDLTSMEKLQKENQELAEARDDLLRQVEISCYETAMLQEELQSLRLHQGQRSSTPERGSQGAGSERDWASVSSDNISDLSLMEELEQLSQQSQELGPPLEYQLSFSHQAAESGSGFLRQEDTAPFSSVMPGHHGSGFLSQENEDDLACSIDPGQHLLTDAPPQQRDEASSPDSAGHPIVHECGKKECARLQQEYTTLLEAFQSMQKQEKYHTQHAASVAPPPDADSDDTAPGQADKDASKSHDASSSDTGTGNVPSSAALDPEVDSDRPDGLSVERKDGTPTQANQDDGGTSQDGASSRAEKRREDDGKTILFESMCMAARKLSRSDLEPKSGTWDEVSEQMSEWKRDERDEGPHALAEPGVWGSFDNDEAGEQGSQVLLGRLVVDRSVVAAPEGSSSAAVPAEDGADLLQQLASLESNRHVLEETQARQLEFFNSENNLLQKKCETLQTQLDTATEARQSLEEQLASHDSLLTMTLSQTRAERQAAEDREVEQIRLQDLEDQMREISLSLAGRQMQISRLRRDFDDGDDSQVSKSNSCCVSVLAFPNGSDGMAADTTSSGQSLSAVADQPLGGSEGNAPSVSSLSSVQPGPSDRVVDAEGRSSFNGSDTVGVVVHSPLSSVAEADGGEEGKVTPQTEDLSLMSDSVASGGERHLGKDGVGRQEEDESSSLTMSEDSLTLTPSPMSVDRVETYVTLPQPWRVHMPGCTASYYHQHLVSEKFQLDSSCIEGLAGTVLESQVRVAVLKQDIGTALEGMADQRGTASQHSLADGAATTAGSKVESSHTRQPSGLEVTQRDESRITGGFYPHHVPKAEKVVPCKGDEQLRLPLLSDTNHSTPRDASSAARLSHLDTSSIDSSASRLTDDADPIVLELDSERDGHAALSAHHFEILEELSQLRKELQETKILYSQENSLLQEALEREQHMRSLVQQGRERTGQGLSASAFSNVSLSGDAVELRQKFAALREKCRLLEEKNQCLHSRLQQQEALVLSLYDKLQRGSPQDLFGQQLRLLQSQRDDLMSRIQAHISEQERLASALSKKTVEEENLRQEKRLLLEKLKSVEQVNEEVASQRVRIAQLEGDQRQLEGELLLRDQAQQDLMRQKRLLEVELSEIESKLLEQEYNLEQEKTSLLRELQEKNLALWVLSSEKRDRSTSSRCRSLQKLQHMDLALPMEDEDPMVNVASSAVSLPEKVPDKLEVTEVCAYSSDSDQGSEFSVKSQFSVRTDSALTRGGLRQQLKLVERRHHQAVEMLRHKLQLEFGVQQARLQEIHAADLAAGWRRCQAQVLPPKKF